MLLEEECKAYQSREKSFFGPWEGLFKIKAKVVRFFYYFKVNTIKFFFSINCCSIVYSNKLSFDSLFDRFLDHYDMYVL